MRVSLEVMSVDVYMPCAAGVTYKLAEAEVENPKEFQVQIDEKNSMAVKLRKSIDDRHNLAAVDLTESPGLWSLKMMRQKTYHEKAIHDELISPEERFTVTRGLPLDYTGTLARVHLSRREELLLRFSESVL